MTAKVIMVLVVFNVLVTEAASASGANSEEDECIVIPASGGSEQIRSCSDSTSLLQAQVRAHSEEGGQMSEDSSSQDDDEESRRRGRRRRYGKKCHLPTEGMACDKYGSSEQCEKYGRQCHLPTSFQYPDSCAPACSKGLVPSADNAPPASVSCDPDTGKLSKPLKYTCVDATAKGKLTVTIVKASGLKSRDWFGDSDPYVIVKLNGNQCDSCRTATVDDSNSPSWNHEINFDISSQKDKLTFEVYDDDTAAVDDELGTVDSSTAAALREVVQKGGEKTYDFPLSGYIGLSGGLGTGSLTVKLKFQA